MNTHNRWLRAQLPGWVEQGVISPAQADTLRGLHPEPKAALPWGMILFFGVGAVVIGLGIILLFAYNWHAIPKFGKLGLIFGALIAAQASGLRLFRLEDWRRQLGEALTVVGIMFFGAGIWLVAQVYHIEEHYPDGFLYWGLGALALAWVMPSVVQGLVAVVVLSIYGCSETFGFNTAIHWAPVLLAVGGGGLAWQQRSRLLLAVTLAGFYLVLLSNCGLRHGNLAVPVALNVSVLLVALGWFARRGSCFSVSAGVLDFFGWGGFLVVVYLLSFGSQASDDLSWPARLAEGNLGWWLAFYGWLPFALALAAWAVVARETWRAKLPLGQGGCERWLLPLVAVLAQFLAFAMPSVRDAELFGPWSVAGIFNLVLLAVAAAWMAEGSRAGELKPTVQGSLLLVALVLARYFDLFESLAARGLAFLVVGGVLFAEGFFYRKARLRAAEKEAPP